MEENQNHQGSPGLSSSSHSLESTTSYTALRYYGLQKRNYYKFLRKDVTQLVSYIISIVPSFYVVHHVMSAIRILQFLLPCLIPGYFNFWKSGTPDKITVNVISALCYIIPPSSAEKTAVIFLIIYNVIQILIIITMLVSTYYFKKNAKLPGFLPSFLYFYHITFGHIFNPIVSFFIFEGFSFLTSKDTRDIVSTPRLIFLSILTLIGVVFNFFFMNIFSGQSLAFRPNSLCTISTSPSIVIFFNSILINIFFGFGVNLNKNYQIVLFAINIIIYACSSVSVFVRGGFIYPIISNIILSSSITGGVFTLVDILFTIFDRKGSVTIFFLFVFFFVAMIIINFFVVQHVKMKNLTTLDNIYSDRSLFVYISSPNRFLSIAKTGIINAHPAIIDQSFFKLGMEKWEKEQLVYLIYAKFIAIYPEETNVLNCISQMIKVHKYHGPLARSMKEQIRVIMKQREGQLTSELRNKISALRKQNQSTRHKLGHVWDVIIRGNMNEIEVATKRALESINSDNIDLKHLLHQYPNNRNVTYFYATFLSNIMADQIASQEMNEKTRLLKPSSNVFDDSTHEFGLKMFPCLPNSIKLQKESPILISSTNEPTTYNKNFENEEAQRKDLDQISGIKNNIEELKIPSIIGARIISSLTVLIAFIIPCIFGLVYTNIYRNNLKKPLTFIGHLAMLRTYSYQVIAFSFKYVGESLNVFNEYDNQFKDPPKSLGSSWDTKKQLEYILEISTQAIQEFSSFKMFDENNYYINQAQLKIFQNTIDYDYYLSPTNVTSATTSIQGALLDFNIQQKTILTANQMTSSILNSSAILNPINNIKPIAENIRDTMDLMIAYLDDKYNQAARIFYLLTLILIILIILIFSLSLTIELKWINSNKKEIYKCLFSLPKNEISQLDDSKYAKKKTNQEEMNKQDDNILKIFNSGGSSNSISDVLAIILLNIFILLLAIGCLFLFVFYIRKMVKIVRTSAPHLNYLQASYSMLLSSQIYFNSILFSVYGLPVPTMTFNRSYNSMLDAMNSSRTYYHLVSSGGPTSNEIPFKGFMDGVKKASPVNCSFSDSYNFSHQVESILGNLFPRNKKIKSSDFFSASSALQCFPVDMTFSLVETILTYSIYPFHKGYMQTIDTKSSTFETIWVMLITPFYDEFFKPLHDSIIPSINEELNKLQNFYIPAIVAFFLLAILLEIIIFIKIKIIEVYFKSVLKLLLHFKASVIFSSSKMNQVLSGDFSIQQNDSLDKNNGFFDTVFTSLPDAIMFANSDYIIQDANQSCKHTFGENINLVGKSIKEFFMSDKFNGNIENLFSSVNSNPTEEIAYRSDPASDIKILKASSMIACGKFVMSCKNVTQSHNYNILILEEKQNSDKLLSTILPPSLVGRVQEGEKNISFSVQSASILFSDIVSFTPWCGSLPAEKVMSTLNILFKRFDSILDTKPTMTKIKCIGDCYMAAGGIFAEINQPSIHAKEVVSFGVKSINEIMLINEEIQQNLKIRVGINTGGPIVAGVLGIGKPTFEILGPAINRAQQMEQSGTPMKVHISAAVYDLICGLNFKIGNRKRTECKGGEMVETYLVEP